MFWASAIIQILVLLPTTFPVLAQLDTCQKLKRPSGIPHSIIRWSLWIVSWILLGIYYSLQKNDLIILSFVQHINALLGLGCLCQELYYSINKSNSGLTSIITTSKGIWIIASIITLITLLSEFLIFSVFNYLADYPVDDEFIQKSLAVFGVLCYFGFLLFLPYDRDQDAKGPGAGFHPLCLLIQLAGFFATVVMLTLLFTDVDGFACLIYVSLIFIQLGVILTHGILRRITNKRTSTQNNEYQSVPLQTI